MGRSQVLYNRTKGRFRNTNRTGVPGPAGRGGAGRGKPGKTVPFDNDHGEQPFPTDDTIQKKHKSNLDESILLVEPSIHFVSKESQTVDEYSIFAQGGIIDIASMAATLTSSMSLAERLRIPAHVAQQLQISLDFTNSKREERAINEDRSFSVYETKVRVDARGPKEARPKHIHNDRPMITSIVESDELITEAESDALDARNDSMGQKATTTTLSPADTTLLQESNMIQGVFMSNEDEDDEYAGHDRYLSILQSNDEEVFSSKFTSGNLASTSDMKSPPSGITGQSSDMSSTNVEVDSRTTSTNIPMHTKAVNQLPEKDDESGLEVWLDQTMISTRQVQSTSSTEYAFSLADTAEDEVSALTEPLASASSVSEITTFKFGGKADESVSPHRAHSFGHDGTRNDDENTMNSRGQAFHDVGSLRPSMVHGKPKIPVAMTEQNNIYGIPSGEDVEDLDAWLDSVIL